MILERLTACLSLKRLNPLSFGAAFDPKATAKAKDDKSLNPLSFGAAFLRQDRGEAVMTPESQSPEFRGGIPSKCPSAKVLARVSLNPLSFGAAFLRGDMSNQQDKIVSIP